MPVEDVAQVEFRFQDVDFKKCDQMFREGKYAELDELLEKTLQPVLVFNYLPGNLSDYLAWQLKAQFWSASYVAARKTAALIHQGNSDPRNIAISGIYKVVALLDTRKFSEADAAFKALENPDELAPAMSDYIRARLADHQEKYREALLHISALAIYHGRDAEWLPSATLLEGQIYKKTNRPEAAKNVAEELMIGYPGTRWSRAGEELKAGL